MRRAKRFWTAADGGKGEDGMSTALTTLTSKLAAKLDMGMTEAT